MEDNKDLIDKFSEEEDDALFKALGATISKASSNKACLPILEIKTLRGTFSLRKPGMLIFLLNFAKAKSRPFFTSSCGTVISRTTL